MPSLDEYIELTTHHVPIGPSATNIKHLYLKTKRGCLSLTPCFFSRPFGTTRTRFQETELFLYKLMQDTEFSDDVLDDPRAYTYTYYDLTIERKKITSTNCPHNAALFGDAGWTVDLWAYNVPKTSTEQLFSLSHNLPVGYGRVDADMSVRADTLEAFAAALS